MMIFGNRNRVDFLNNTLNININGSKMKTVENAKNLDLVLDNKFRFKEHLKNLF